MTEKMSVNSSEYYKCKAYIYNLLKFIVSPQTTVNLNVSIYLL